MTIKERLIDNFPDEEFTLQDAYSCIDDKPATTVRGRIYDNLGIAFERVKEGVYRTIRGDEQCILLEGDGRDLSFLSDSSVDCIITDHPWQDSKANKGGNRSFADYECFEYIEEDFKEKARVLKDGCFLVEMLPAENETNFDYLYKIKKMAQKAGFQYYSKVPWKKGTFVSNTGRKAKNTEDMMIFSKGKPRAMRPNVKENLKEPGIEHFMSGTAKMLPTNFDVQAVHRKNVISQSEKPVGLVEELLDYITFEKELVLDQFAGSGVVGEACLNKGRNCILIEKSPKSAEAIRKRLNLKEDKV
jgi:site-specific DNA-methyltransferase (adenine-specific)